MNLRKNPTLAQMLTQEFLEHCKEVGLSIVAIYTDTPLLEESKRWRKDDWTELCVFGNDVRYGPWPAIWAAVDRFEKTHPEIRRSCGNANQAQVAPDILKKGVYQLKEGFWERS